MDEVLGIASFTNGVILGVFLLGHVHHGVQRRGAFVGMATGAAVMLAVKLLTPIHWQWYVLIGSLTTFTAGVAGQPRARRPCRLISPASRACSTTPAAAGPFPPRASRWAGAVACIWQYATGRLTYDDDAPATDLDTVFDLASLTKVIATAPLLMQLVATRRAAVVDAGAQARARLARPGPARRDA